jgi:hypothetical protein
MAQVRYTTEQCVCLMQLYFKYESARIFRRKFQCNFPGESVSSNQNIHYLVNKMKTTGSFLGKKKKRKEKKEKDRK